MKYSINELGRIIGSPAEFAMDLSESELSLTPNIKAIDSLKCTLEAKNIASDAYIVSVKVEVKAKIIDDHDFKVKNFIQEEIEDIVVSLNPDIDNEIEMEKGNLIDFRPTALALYYNMIPTSYSTSALTSHEIEGVTIISQDEYDRNHGNAFSGLSSLSEEMFSEEEDDQD